MPLTVSVGQKTVETFAIRQQLADGKLTEEFNRFRDEYGLAPREARLRPIIVGPRRRMATSLDQAAFPGSELHGGVGAR